MAESAVQRLPVPRQEEIRLNARIELRALPVVVDGEAAGVNIVQVQPVGMPHLVADEQHPGLIYCQLDGNGISGVARLLMKGKGVFLPGERRSRRKTPVDRDWLVPEAGQIVGGRMLEHVGEDFGSPYLGAL